MSRKIQTFQQFKDELEQNSDLQVEFREDPLKAVQQFEQRIIDDKWVYRIVVTVLGAIILLIVTGVIILLSRDGTAATDADKLVPTIFTAIGSGAIGALAGLLAPAPQR
ncbi:hypothetical protein [Chitinophaga japonensis]|uniref:Uncharacterized protein n=1 Tax=Chitinophaga japonensis TaxID=104662 RepID=A0A562SLF5_CHIJA|nr:hypothetical protein [Chitinophaga japonensis]TWI81983.1 hypothetical protein LX66_5299 [Chitinophaga japonensis]